MTALVALGENQSAPYAEWGLWRAKEWPSNPRRVRRPG